jgi:geranylgeranyl diphosphate synthase type II
MMTSNEMFTAVPPAVLVQTVQLISLAAGYQGMVGGQVVDMQSEGKDPDLETVKYMHARKTGALITASVTAGAVIAGAGEDAVSRIRSYGQKAGLAFQIADDILDIEGDSEILGKQTGSDENKGKMTYPAVLGLVESKRIQSDLIQSAISDLSEFGNKAEPLRQIARYIIERKK